MRLLVPIVVAFALGVVTAPALAQDDKVYAPPGNSGIEEYLEVVPGAGGNKPATGGGQIAKPRPAETLGADRARALERLGPDGRAAAAAAAAGSPADAKSTRERARKLRSRDSTLSDSSSIATKDGGNEVTTVARALSGDGGGIGAALPALLVLTLVIALGIGARRLLRRS